MRRCLGWIGVLAVAALLAGCASLEEPYFDEDFREVPAADAEYPE